MCRFQGKIRSHFRSFTIFYRDGLGLPTRGIVGREFEHGALALFDLQHGLKLAIFPVILLLM
jgi:hypothetical protein